MKGPKNIKKFIFYISYKMYTSVVEESVFFFLKMFGKNINLQCGLKFAQNKYKEG